jgi:glycerol-3-phosphate dehydrogenase (NAD(P)+)
MKISIIGAGSWGTALSIYFGRREFDVKIWCYEKEVEEDINKNRENRTYLEGFRIPEKVSASTDLRSVLKDAEIIIFATPSHVTREVLMEAAPYLPPDAPLISVTKGIEVETLKLMSQVYEEIIEDVSERFAVISGPTFAREVARGLPAAATIASKNTRLSNHLQRLLSDTTFRLYESSDVIGVEVGGAVKNVIAIAAGICDGLKLGLNARAAIITRGLAEMTRLGVKMGANPLTFLGLSGIGDLVLTCTGDLSRNRMVGVKLGEGKRLKDIILSTPMVAEGVKTSIAVKALSEREGVEMPISETVYRILHEGMKPEEGARVLMARSLKEELYGISLNR